MKLVVDIPERDYEYLKKLKVGHTDYGLTLHLYSPIRNGTPPAQPERKKGKWIFEECKGNTYFRCSECGEIVTSAIMGFPRYEYCPMCGADMRGEE